MFTSHFQAARNLIAMILCTGILMTIGGIIAG